MRWPPLAPDWLGWRFGRWTAEEGPTGTGLGEERQAPRSNRREGRVEGSWGGRGDPAQSRAWKPRIMGSMGRMEGDPQRLRPGLRQRQRLRLRLRLPSTRCHLGRQSRAGEADGGSFQVSTRRRRCRQKWDIRSRTAEREGVKGVKMHHPTRNPDGRSKWIGRSFST